jgi:hypothetical protein
MKPRTKKNPTSSPAKKTDAGLANETPKGSGPSVAPSLEERVAALEMVVTRLSLGVADLLGDLSNDLRRRWEENRFYELTQPLNESTREQAFEEWQAENFARADQKVRS